MKSLRDEIDEAITAILVREMGATTKVDPETGSLVTTSGGCIINVDEVVNVVMETIRNNAA